MKNFKITELLILGMSILLIFVSEYYYLVEGNVNKAIFIGLWPPTIIVLMIYITIKTKNRMENLDIYILTSVMVILFLVFIIGIYRTVKDADMLKLIGKMFDNENIPNKEKKLIYKAIHRTISDMESDGVYFPKK